MPRLLFQVKSLNSHPIRGRGLVVESDRTYETLDPEMKLRIGDAIEFRHPGRASIRSRVIGIEHLNPWSPRQPFVFLLPMEISQDQIAVGSEVWQLVDDR